MCFSIFPSFLVPTHLYAVSAAVIICVVGEGGGPPPRFFIFILSGLWSEVRVETGVEGLSRPRHGHAPHMANRVTEHKMGGLVNRVTAQHVAH